MNTNNQTSFCTVNPSAAPTASPSVPGSPVQGQSKAKLKKTRSELAPGSDNKIRELVDSSNADIFVRPKCYTADEKKIVRPVSFGGSTAKVSTNKAQRNSSQPNLPNKDEIAAAKTFLSKCPNSVNIPRRNSSSSNDDISSIKPSFLSNSKASTGNISRRGSLLPSLPPGDEISASTNNILPRLSLSGLKQLNPLSPRGSKDRTPTSLDVNKNEQLMTSMEVLKNLNFFYKLLFEQTIDDEKLADEVPRILKTVQSSFEFGIQNFFPENSKEEVIGVFKLVQQLRKRPAINKTLEGEYKSVVMHLNFSHLFYQRICEVEGMLTLLRLPGLKAMIDIIADFTASECAALRKYDEGVSNNSIFTPAKEIKKTLIPIDESSLERLVQHLALHSVFNPRTERYEDYGAQLADEVYSKPTPVYIRVENSCRGKFQKASAYFKDCKRALKEYKKWAKWTQNAIEMPKKFESLIKEIIENVKKPDSMHKGGEHSLPKLIDTTTLEQVLDHFKNNEYGNCFDSLGTKAEKHLMMNNYLILPKESFIPVVVAFVKRFIILMSRQIKKTTQETQNACRPLIELCYTSLYQAVNYLTREEISAICKEICANTNISITEEIIEKVCEEIDRHPGLPSKEKIAKWICRELHLSDDLHKQLFDRIVSSIKPKINVSIQWKKLEEIFTSFPKKYEAILKLQSKAREHALKVFNQILDRMKKNSTCLGFVKHHPPIKVESKRLCELIRTKNKGFELTPNHNDAEAENDVVDVCSIFTREDNLDEQTLLFEELLGIDLGSTSSVLIEFICTVLPNLTDIHSANRTQLAEYLEEVYPHKDQLLSWERIENFLKENPPKQKSQEEAIRVLRFLTEMSVDESKDIWGDMNFEESV